jgi:SMODS-associating 4TM effector domain
MSMLEQQNSPENLELLAAMRHLYNCAKRIRTIRVIVNIVLALAAVFYASTDPQAKEWLALIGLVWLFVTRFLQEKEKNYTKTAATIQEEFDTNLFGIPWNRSLVGNKIPPEEIKKAAKRLKDNRNSLKNWYTGLNAPNKISNVLLAQRTNLIWDARRRKKYAFAVGFITATYFAFTIYLGWNTSIKAYLLTILIPSLPILLHGFDTCKAHWSRANRCEQVGEKVLATFESNLKAPDPNILQTCREYQDFIYQKRCDTALVPNWWYKIWREEDEDIMKTVNERLSGKAVSGD